MKPSVCVLGDGYLAQVTRECLTTTGFDLHDVDNIKQAQIVWVAYDTPIDAISGQGHPILVKGWMDRHRAKIADNTIVLVSSQVPIGFTRAVEREWRTFQPSLKFAYSPENIRAVPGTGVQDFMSQSRIIVGLGEDTSNEDWSKLRALFEPFTQDIHCMNLESAEMVKHALNGYLAISAAFANEMARIGIPLGVDPCAVERALRADPRVGEKAYVKAAGPITGGHLLRDVHVLCNIAKERGVSAPLAGAILESDKQHAKAWEIADMIMPLRIP